MRLCIGFVFFLFFTISAFCEFYLVEPPNTILISKEEKSKDKSLSVVVYKYETELPSDHIISFYRSVLKNLGFRESKKKFSDNSIFFTKGLVSQVLLYIYPQIKNIPDNKQKYSITVWDIKDILFLSGFSFQAPLKIDFAPVLDNAVEAFQVIDGNPVKLLNHHLYLSNKGSEEITRFYKQNMVKYGWELKNEVSYSGRQNFLLKYLEDMFRDAGIDPNSLYPNIEVNFKSITLEYEQKGKSCVVNIIEFLDPPQVLEENRIDPEAFIRYGNVLISLNMAEKTFENIRKETRKIFDKSIEDLKNFLGY